MISRVNDQYVKIAKVKGKLAWHNHIDEDELFLVVRGRLLIQLESEEIELNAGDMYVVPKRRDAQSGRGGGVLGDASRDSHNKTYRRG